MKVAIASDLHLEFGPITLDNSQGADVLVLSGDILVENDLDTWVLPQVESGFARKRSVMYHTFFQECSEAFPHVIYVAGNHEHYHGDFKYTVSNLKDKLGYLDNVHVLDRDTFTYHDVTFIGSTLWTDMNRGDELTLYHMRSAMNDFRCVTNSHKVVSYKVPLYEKDAEGKYIRDEKGNYIQSGVKMKQEPAKFSPEDAMNEHYKNVAYIRTVIEGMKKDAKVVVVGHHTPSHRSCHPHYAHDELMNGGYHSDLEDFILDRPQIKLWTHGHTHDDFDYMVGDTRVVCNPRGYVGYEARSRTWELKVVEI